MTRWRWLFVPGAVAVVGAAVAAGVIASNSAARPFGPPRVRAQQLLNELVLPSGAQRLRVAPHGDGGLLHQAQSIPGATLLAHLHRIWRVHGSFFNVPSFVENRLPRDAQGGSRAGASRLTTRPFNAAVHVLNAVATSSTAMQSESF